MKKIGITGSVASGKSTASKYLSFKRGLFLVQMMPLKSFIEIRILKN